MRASRDRDRVVLSFSFMEKDLTSVGQAKGGLVATHLNKNHLIYMSFFSVSSGLKRKMLFSLNHLYVYTFPLLTMINRDLYRMLVICSIRMTLVAPYFLQQERYRFLLSLIEEPRELPHCRTCFCRFTHGNSTATYTS